MKNLILSVIFLILLFICIFLAYEVFKKPTRIEVKNTSANYKITYHDDRRKSFEDMLTSWKVWKKGNIKDPHSNTLYSISHIVLATTDKLNPHYTYRHYTDATKNSIILSTNYEFDKKDGATITIFLDPIQAKQLEPRILNYYVLNGILKTIYTNRAKVFLFKYLQTVMEGYSNHPEQNPISISFIK